MKNLNAEAFWVLAGAAALAYFWWNVLAWDAIERQGLDWYVWIAAGASIAAWIVVWVGVIRRTEAATAEEEGLSSAVDKWMQGRWQVEVEAEVEAARWRSRLYWLGSLAGAIFIGGSSPAFLIVGALWLLGQVSRRSDRP